LIPGLVRGDYDLVICCTPLLIQLLCIFYGLGNIGIKLSPFLAGVIGLGLNYAAYEAENYRAGLLAVNQRRPGQPPGLLAFSKKK
jgi:polar amino acid transport system substrate-binding protein